MAWEGAGVMMWEGAGVMWEGAGMTWGRVGMVAGGFTVWGAIRTGELGAILPIDQTGSENGYLASTAVTCFDTSDSGMIP